MTESGFRPTGTPDLAVAKSHNDFAMLEPREQLATLLKEHVVGRPFSELAAVTFDHRAATVMGHVLIDALEDAGYSIDDFDAVGALTAASVPMVSAMIQAAASRGEDLDGCLLYTSQSECGIVRPCGRCRTRTWRRPRRVRAAVWRSSRPCRPA